MKAHSASLPRQNRQRGISLFEMLLTVAILGVMLSLAMPLFGAQNDVYAGIKAKRNAQELVAECTAAQAAGVDFVVAGDLPATVENIVKGGVATSGVFKGRTLGLKGLAAEDAKDAARFLKLSGGDLQMR